MSETKRLSLLGALGGGVGGLVFVIVGAILVGVAGIGGDYAFQYAMVGVFLAPVVALLSAILGAPLALVATRGVTGTGLQKRVPLATGLAVSFILAVGCWAWLAGEQVLIKLRQRSADSLIEIQPTDTPGPELSPGEVCRGACPPCCAYDDLSSSDLRSMNLGHANLFMADLSSSDLRNVDLTGADLREANLSGVNLEAADLTGAKLVGADLSGANLRDAVVTDEQLAAASSLKGATMPDGTVHE